jgi:hypothetical protein
LRALEEESREREKMVREEREDTKEEVGGAEAEFSR